MNTLVCEDDSRAGTDLFDHLRAAGFEPIGPVGDSHGALDLADTTHIDAAIIDINLSDGRSGVALARELHGRGIPIIVCSSEELAPNELNDMKHVFVSKPADGAVLTACVRSAIRSARLA